MRPLYVRMTRTLSENIQKVKMACLYLSFKIFNTFLSFSLFQATLKGGNHCNDGVLHTLRFDVRARLLVLAYSFAQRSCHKLILQEAAKQQPVAPAPTHGDAEKQADAAQASDVSSQSGVCSQRGEEGYCRLLSVNRH